MLLFLFCNSAQQNSKTETVIQSGHKDKILGLAFLPDAKVLTSVTKDNKVKLWNINSGLEITTLHGHKEAVKFVLD